MVRCVYCPNFTRTTCYCKHYKQTIKLEDVHKQISCPGCRNRARLNWILKAASKQENPDVQAEMLYSVLGDKKQ